MLKFFKEKHITIKKDEGQRLDFFMRPITVGELQIIRRICVLAELQTEDNNLDEFITPTLLSLMLDCCSIDGSKIPILATENLIQAFIDFNFPDAKEKDIEKKDTDKKDEDVRTCVLY